MTGRLHFLQVLWVRTEGVWDASLFPMGHKSHLFKYLPTYMPKKVGRWVSRCSALFVEIDNFSLREEDKRQRLWIV